jgi:hypothetical protein
LTHPIAKGQDARLRKLGIARRRGFGETSAKRAAARADFVAA